MPNKFRSPETYLENTDQTLVLVDYSNLLYRAWFVSAKRPWVAYCKFFDMLRLCVKRSKQKGVPIKVIFCDESHTELERRKIFKEYKGTRTHIEDPKFFKFRKELAELIRYLGWELVHENGFEADDVIASIVAKYCHRCFCKVPCDDCDCALKYTTDVVIFSGDRDLQQCLSWDRTLIYRAPGIFIDRQAFELEYGIPVAKYVVYKALVGDRSDNIKGVDGFGPAKARIAIHANSVAEDIWEIGGIKSKNEFALALQLVNLNYKLDCQLDDIYMGPPLFDESEFIKKYDERILLEVQRLGAEF